MTVFVTRRSVAVVTLLLASALSACGSGRCGPPPLKPVVEEGLYGTYAGPGGARITLRYEGPKVGATFSAENWPVEEKVSSLDARAVRFDGDGYWEWDSARDGDAAEVRLEFRKLDAGVKSSTITALEIGDGGRHAVLSTPVGDPDVCRVFVLKWTGN
ncbi:hypothetical protein [Streptomyces sp. NPDC003077]|uniref:hypothetical protein n=1 Tax=Streptomyces sp. NPDC003077 TaxID=3154443 RepID=UPI0033BB36DD